VAGLSRMRVQAKMSNKNRTIGAYCTYDDDVSATPEITMLCFFFVIRLPSQTIQESYNSYNNEF
jgi:hypothetical protein